MNGSSVCVGHTCLTWSVWDRRGWSPGHVYGDRPLQVGERPQFSGVDRASSHDWRQVPPWRSTLRSGGRTPIPIPDVPCMPYMPTLTPLAPPQLIRIYGSPMECLGMVLRYRERPGFTERLGGFQGGLTYGVCSPVSNWTYVGTGDRCLLYMLLHLDTWRRDQEGSGPQSSWSSACSADNSSACSACRAQLPVPTDLDGCD